MSGIAAQRVDPVPYCALARRTTDQTAIPTNSGATVLDLNTTVKETVAGMADLVNNKIIIPRAGLYRVNFMLDLQMDGTNTNGVFYQFDVKVIRDTNAWVVRQQWANLVSPSGSAAAQFSGAVDAQFAANDKIRIEMTPFITTGSNTWRVLYASDLGINFSAEFIA